MQVEIPRCLVLCIHDKCAGGRRTLLTEFNGVCNHVSSVALVLMQNRNGHSTEQSGRNCRVGGSDRQIPPLQADIAQCEKTVNVISVIVA